MRKIRAPFLVAYAVLLMLVIAPIMPHPVAMAADRVHKLCYESGTSMTCSEDALQKLIDDAGAAPTQIELGAGETRLTKTLTIPAGADIELVNLPDQASGTTGTAGGSALVRDDAMTGVLVDVAAQAKLTLSAGKTGTPIAIRSRGTEVPAAAATVKVRGEFTLNAGEISGARELSNYYGGAVAVAGDGALFTMNGGKVTDNQRRQNAGDGVRMGAANVAVSDRATFVMNDGEISDGVGEPNTQAVGEAGGLGLYGGAQATINGGVIKNNRSWGGGVVVMTWANGQNPRESLKHDARERRSSLTLKGGEITGNAAGFAGGGIAIFSNAEVTMTGGKISQNWGRGGGGVNAMDLYVWGAPQSYDEVPGEGKKNGYSAEEWSEYSPAAFTMTGGEISENVAALTGGGVNIVSNRVTLSGGRIADNTAYMQGGGVYVTTASYTGHILNAIVTGNHASSYGGGIWTCPTGGIDLNVTQGAAIFGNTADKKWSESKKNAYWVEGMHQWGDDLAHDNYESVSSAPVMLAPRMLGGGLAHWYDDGSGANPERFDAANPGEPRQPDTKFLIDEQGLKNVTDDESHAAAKCAARLMITGNKAPRGAGIGTNGKVVFGIPEVTSLKLSKQWLDENKKPLAENKYQDKSVLVDVIPSTSAADSCGNAKIQTVELNKANNWSASLENLPKVDAAGNPISYTVKEHELAGFTADSTVTQAEDGSWNAVVTNTVVPTPPPADNPPADNPPADNPPADNPPAENPPADPPVDNPPADNPPADNPPVPSEPTPPSEPAPQPKPTKPVPTKPAPKKPELAKTGVDMPSTALLSVLMLGLGVATFRARRLRK